MTLKENITMENNIIQKESLDPGVVSEREEGEISDLDLEDVSDCSLSSNKSFKNDPRIKSLKPRNSIEYFSCVSDSETDNELRCSVCKSYKCNGFECTYRRSLSRRYSKDRKYKYKYGKRKPRGIMPVTCELSPEWNYSSDHGRIIRSPSIISSTGSENESVDRSLLLKLDKAVRVNTSKPEQFQTSLRSRLNNMVNSTEKDDFQKTDSDSECELMELRKLALESKLRECIKNEKRTELVESKENTGENSPKKEEAVTVESINEHLVEETKGDITDEEAQKLRLDALRSAVLKKHQIRRQRQSNEPKEINQRKSEGAEELDKDLVQIKTVINDLLEYIIADNSSSASEDIPQTVIDNSVQNNENESKEIENVNENSDHIEEDEDILRAMLLTSVAKKMSEKSILQADQTVSKNSVAINNKFNDIKRISKKTENTQIKIVDIPVQRLVINVGADSESDSDQGSTAQTTNIPAQFEASLTQFLKEARANVEKQQANKAKLPLAVQRLPESRQAEYLKLKSRLEQLTKNKKMFQTDICANTTTQTKKTDIFQKMPLKAPQISKKLIGFSSLHNKNKKILINNTLESNKFQKRPLLQVKKPNSPRSNFVTQKRFLEGKYKDLAPIVKKTKAARLARDQAGEEVTQLIEKLKVARIRYNDCHQQYKNCIQEYLLLKSNIEADSSVQNSKLVKDDSAPPVKKKPKLQENHPLKANLPSAPNLNVVKIAGKQVKYKNRVFKKSNIGKQPTHAIATSSSVSENILKTKRRSIDSNPLIEICPYDLQGSCRDVECKYRHLESSGHVKACQ